MADSNPYNNQNLTGANPAQMAPSSPIISEPGKGVLGTVGAPSTSPAFDINKLTAAAQDYAAMNMLANQMLGYDVKWFIAVPQQRSKDVIFQEYTLYNVDECPLEIKVVLPGGQFPDSKYTYDLMGLEYEVPLEVQIDKRYWESIAGYGTAPQKKDIIYFVMPNKLYQVESTYLFRGFMEQETAWKINLRKYMPEASRREGEYLQQTIDQYTVSSEEIFGTATDNDVAKLVDDKQMNQFNGTSKDLYKNIDSKLQSITQDLNIFGTVVAQSYYDLTTPLWYDAITYNSGDTVSRTSDRAITAWINSLPSTNKLYDVTSINEVSTDPSGGYSNFSITVSSSMLANEIKAGETIVISRPGALNFYAKVVTTTSNPFTIYCAINPLVWQDLVEINENWQTQKGYKLQRKEPISVLDGVNDHGEHVLSVNVYANQYIAISYGHTYLDSDTAFNSYVVRMDEKLDDNKWYGIVVNIGNSWKQYSAYVWKKHETDKNAKLQSIFSKTLRLLPDDVTVDHYSINKSPAYITNIRLFNNTIEEDRQSNELLSYFSKDGDKLIIGDNADPLLRLPYITRQR